MDITEQVKTIAGINDARLTAYAEKDADEQRETTIIEDMLASALKETHRLLLEQNRIIEAARAVGRQYENWFEDAPEDSWRLQRDLFAALIMEKTEEEGDE